MTTQDLIETFINEGMSAFKKNHRDSKNGRMLDRHQPCVIEGHTFSYWRELIVYAMCKYIQEQMPDVDVTCILDGNNSTLELTLSDSEQRELNSKLFVFLKKNNCI